MLRKLKIEDAERMLEWMNDIDVVKDLDNKAFGNTTIEDCKKFINNSINDNKNIHYAITDCSDKYLGTISLKNINLKESEAEYAVVLRKENHGKNVALDASYQLFDIAKKAGFKRLYLYLNKKNIRAHKFYIKSGWKFTNSPKISMKYDIPLDKYEIFERVL